MNRGLAAFCALERKRRILPKSIVIVEDVEIILKKTRSALVVFMFSTAAATVKSATGLNTKLIARSVYKTFSYD